MGDNWQPGKATAAYGDATGRSIGVVEIVGWVNGDWILDFRVGQYERTLTDRSCWGLSHIPTGWFCCAIYASLETAKSIASEIADWGDWRVDDTHEKIASAFRAQAKSTMKKHSPIVRFGPSPLFSQVTHDLWFANNDPSGAVLGEG